jgi:hypothetical protein
MTLNVPTPLNQFNRLIERVPLTAYDLGSRWNDVVHGQNLDSVNCMATMGAVAIDAHTGGRTLSSPTQIRGGQTDFSGGIGVDDVDDAWFKLWGLHLLTPQADNWTDVMNRVKEGRFVIVAVNYAYVPYAYQEQKGGIFDHALGICDYRASDGSVLRYDGLGRAPRRVPQSAVRGAAEALAIRERGRADHLFVGITGVMPAPPASGVTYRFGGKPTYRGRYLSRSNTPNHLAPVREAPNQSANVTTRLRKGQSFRCAQTTKGEGLNGNTIWHGTADGRCWINDSLVWYAGHSTGKETVR